MIGSMPLIPCADSPSAIAFTSSGCRPQNCAIWSKESAVLSTSQTAVALGIRRVFAIDKFLSFARVPVAGGGQTTEFWEIAACIAMFAARSKNLRQPCRKQMSCPGQVAHELSGLILGTWRLG